MAERKKNYIESTLHRVMHFLGSTTRSIRNDFYPFFSFTKSKKTEKREVPVAGKENVTEEATNTSLSDSLTTSLQEPFSFRPRAKEAEEKKEIREIPKETLADTTSFFKGIEFKNNLEEIKAETFVNDFRSRLPEVQTKALRQLRELSKPAAIEVLKRLLSSEEDIVQDVEILNILSELNDGGKFEKKVFTDFSKHPNLKLRLTAMRALAKYRDEESFSTLSSYLNDGNVEVRRQALNCLSWFFPDKCASGVLKLLHDVDNRVRKSAVRICGSLKLSQCISTLIALLSDSNGEIQKSAAASLRKITGQHFDFKATGSEKNKEVAIENWHFWWRDNQAKLGV